MGKTWVLRGKQRAAAHCAGISFSSSATTHGSNQVSRETLTTVKAMGSGWNTPDAQLRGRLINPPAVRVSTFSG
jgi:hypothetical protein